MIKPKRIHYDTWLKRYKPIQNPIKADSPYDGIMFETCGEEDGYVRAVAFSTPKMVWTLVGTETGIYIANGYHWVNRLGYFITENPCMDDFVDVQL